MKLKSHPNPVVLVPVHRSQPTLDEQFSLQRCGQVLRSHPIRIVHPAGLNLEYYRDLLPKAKPLPVPATWMASIRAYNRMMINPAFYRMLNQFSHALVHEPDSLVISDELYYWCEQPFDFIGAPWFEGFHAAASDAHIIGVGNSGFSLINIASICHLLESNHRWISRMLIAKEFSKKLFFHSCRYSSDFLAAAFGAAGLLSGAHKVLEENWDFFLLSYVHRVLPHAFKIADPQTALQFCWEVNPVKCSELCDQRPPFGLHAWSRYNRPFVMNMLNSLPEMPIH